MFDAARKSLQLAQRLAEAAGLAGWRKAQYRINQFKSYSRQIGKLFYSRAKNKDEKVQQATQQYLKLACSLSQRLDVAEADFAASAENSLKQQALLDKLKYFKGHLDNQIDLVTRRILNKEVIPHSQKVFSIFEPYIEWIKRGKAGKPQELGLSLAVATDQFGFTLKHNMMQNLHEKDLAVPMAKEIIEKFDVQGMSFDKNYWTPVNYQILSELVPDLVLPKKGKLNAEEYERQHSKTFITLRKQHSAVESAINCLEHHGLNRCPDRGLRNFKKYAALGILACNLHKLGTILQEKERKKSKNKLLQKAA